MYLVPQKPCIIAASMCFWSVSWSTNCSVYFSFFLVDQLFFWSTKNKFGWPKKIGWPKTWENSPVHVVLVSLLVDQLSSLFLSFFWSTKKKLFGLREFLVRLWFYFGRPNFFLVHQNIFLVYQKIKAWPYQSIPNIVLVNQIFFGSTKFLFGIPKFFWSPKFIFGQPKKLEIDQTIGRPKRLTKSTWTPLV